MTSPGLKLYLAVAGFWATRPEGLRRWAGSISFWLVMIAITAVGVSAISALGDLLDGASATVKFLGVLGITLLMMAWIAGMLLVMLTPGVTSIQAARHPQTPAQALAQCRELLDRHGFKIEAESASGLRAERNRGHHVSPVESEWRELPFETWIEVSPADGGALVTARCTCQFGVNRRFRNLVASTSKAVAELDAQALAALDATVTFKQGGMRMGLYANRISTAICGGVFVTGIVLLLAAWFYGSRLHEYTMGYGAFEAAQARAQHVFDSMDLPLREELDRYLAARAPGKAAPSPADALRDFRLASGQDSLVLAVREPTPKGAKPDPHRPYILVLPREGSPMRPLAQALLAMDSAATAGRVSAVADRTFVRLDYQYRQRLESRLGLKSGQIFGGWLVTFDELAARAPRVGFHSTTFTVYRAGRSVVEYRWTKDGPRVARGDTPLSSDVLRSTSTFLFPGWMDVFIRPDWADSYRVEQRGPDYLRVVYDGALQASGWNGYVQTQPLGFTDYFTSQVAEMAIAVTLAVIGLLMLIILFVPDWIARRLSQPVLQTRDALRAIAAGDYSVRLDATRKDEVGQLQKVVNRLAEELGKRGPGR